MLAGFIDTRTLTSCTPPLCTPRYHSDKLKYNLNLKKRVSSRRTRWARLRPPAYSVRSLQLCGGVAVRAKRLEYCRGGVFSSVEA